MTIYKVITIVRVEKLTLTTAHCANKNSTRLSSAVQNFFFDFVTAGEKRAAWWSGWYGDSRCETVVFATETGHPR